mmetsp:Transcript_108943/g.325849  ORF Transcript_108943/g.325849 Transcript_108943/m.325849 type:complete len:287 (+) Transcript_108943:281-1141(+)
MARGVLRPEGMLWFTLSTNHLACATSPIRTSAAASVFPGCGGSFLTETTVPYWLKTDVMFSSVISVENPVMNNLSVAMDCATSFCMPPMQTFALYLPGPLDGSSMASNITWAPFTRTSPSASSLICTKTSGPPLSGTMKPKPFWVSQRFTTPLIMTPVCRPGPGGGAVMATGAMPGMPGMPAICAMSGKPVGPGGGMPAAFRMSTSFWALFIENCTHKGVVRPTGMFWWILSTSHFASSRQLIRMRATRSGFPGTASRVLHCTTLPYCAKIDFNFSSSMSSGKPWM